MAKLLASTHPNRPHTSWCSLFAQLVDYSHNRWEAGFRWHYAWAGVAAIREMNGTNGSKGAAPIGNAVQRV